MMVPRRYWFQLNETVSGSSSTDVGAVDAPEWLVPLAILESVANECGLELKKAQNFHDFVLGALGHPDREMQGAPPGTMRPISDTVLGSMRHGGVFDAEWRVAHLYTVLRFVKRIRAAPAAAASASFEEMMESLKAAKDKAGGEAAWKALDKAERNRRQQAELAILRGGRA